MGQWVQIFPGRGGVTRMCGGGGANGERLLGQEERRRERGRWSSVWEWW